MSEKINVKKRNGNIEPLQLEKLHRMVSEACDGISGVSISQVEMSSGIQFYDGITTEDIQEILIKSAADLISLENPGYQFVAARLLLFSLRKKIYGGRIDLPDLEHQIKKGVEMGIYDSILIESYTLDEIAKLNEYIDHRRDLNFTYAGLRQVIDKYLVQDRVDKTVYETPQFMYMLIAMRLFAAYPKDTRLSYVKRYYDASSKHKINIPTPIMAGVRTKKKQGASCVLIEADDSLDSIIASGGVVMKYVADKAGIGLNVGRIRELGSKIRGGETISTGLIPYLRYFQGALESVHQGGLRKGSMTVFVPLWHKEIEQVIVMKNNKGNEETRARNIDYAIGMSKIFYERFIQNGVISLFCPHDVPGLFDAFGLPEFDDLYEKYEADSTINKKQVGAQELIIKLLNERSETGRIYIFNIDHVNSHSSFLDKINQSNLCVAPETQVFTSDGYQMISELEGEYVDIWNGEEWSNVQIVKTSERQELIKVMIDSEYIECTPYHRFFVMDEKTLYAKTKKIIEKRAHELKSGDKLIKFDLPVIEGEKELIDAYTLGFHTGDGSYCNGKPILDLYGKKQEVLEELNYRYFRRQESQNCTRLYLNIPSHTKFIVPTCEYTIESRLKWFAGLVDSDGHIAKNGNTETIQIASIHFDFLKEIKYMLHTLGVNAKITNGCEASHRLMPDGHGGQKEYACKQTWRLLISNTGLARLCNLDFHTYTKNSNIAFNIPNRNAERYNVVEEVIYTGRFDATYCFTEHNRGMGMFNGFLLGNCLEVTLPTSPIDEINDVNGEIALCVLGAVNVGVIKSDKELEDATDLIVRGLDEVVDFQDYPIPAAEKSTRARRSLGVGFIGLAHYFARLGASYEEQSAWDYTHQLAESFQYYLLKASVAVAKEKGACEYFNRTKYSQGILPIDTYKKEVDEISNIPLKHDWDELRQDILTYGLRHSTLSSYMPSESSSVISNATNGIEPPKELLSVKRRLKQIVPQYSTLKNNYTTVWEMSSNKGYLNVAAVLQKFTDQAISINWNYNPEKYPDKLVPMSEIVNDWLYAYKTGAKTAYYLNTYDGASDDKKVDDLIGEILNDTEEEDCDGCKI